MDSGAGDVEYVFTLTVTDNKGTTAATDTVTITVTAPSFDALVAEAGPDQDNVASQGGDRIVRRGRGPAPDPVRRYALV